MRILYAVHEVGINVHKQVTRNSMLMAETVLADAKCRVAASNSTRETILYSL